MLVLGIISSIGSIGLFGRNTEEIRNRISLIYLKT